jgi:xylulose-5-phosphate/fructose-6-phosphate phosphoketolase
MKSYEAEELFDEDGRLMPELAERAPKGHRQMDADPDASLSEYSGSSPS